MSRTFAKLPATPASDVQLSEAPVASGAFADRPAAEAGSYAAGAATSSPRSPLQFHGGGGGGGGVHEIAASAFQGSGSALPHQDKIEASFGTDMSSVQAYTGGAASAACDALGAQAFAMGNQIAFKEASPGAHTAAHEAAHVVQQSQGVQLSGGVGKAGDSYEKAADAAADRVVQGKSAGDLIGTPGKASGDGVQKKDAPLASLGPAPSNAGVQLLGTPLDEELPEGAEAPGHGETRGKQRKYTVDQYVEMWEAERGRPMTKAEKKTLARGCIGITALNIEAVNPPLDNAYATFDQAKKVVDEWNAFIEKHKGERTADGKVVGHFKAVLFAKLFWSNQSPDPKEREKPDDTAFLPDEDGKVDMSGYEYRAQGGGKWINFDYGFWDDDSNSFWHANHCEPGMEVYQSTKDKFAAGYLDFDRIVFCAVIAKNYKAMNAARAH